MRQKTHPVGSAELAIVGWFRAPCRISDYRENISPNIPVLKLVFSNLASVGELLFRQRTLEVLVELADEDEELARGLPPVVFRCECCPEHSLSTRPWGECVCFMCLHRLATSS